MKMRKSHLKHLPLEVHLKYTENFFPQNTLTRLKKTKQTFPHFGKGTHSVLNLNQVQKANLSQHKLKSRV